MRPAQHTVSRSVLNQPTQPWETGVRPAQHLDRTSDVDMWISACGCVCVWPPQTAAVDVFMCVGERSLCAPRAVSVSHEPRVWERHVRCTSYNLIEVQLY